MTTEQTRRNEMVEVGKLLWQRNLVGASEGNLSCRITETTLLCTPSGVSKGHLTAEDLVIVDLEGNAQSEGTASSEIRLHLAFYRELPACQAVVHAHPLTATSFALAHREIPEDVLPEAIVLLGKVALVPFGMPGTHDLPNSVVPFLHTHRTFLLANHGAATYGSNLMDAFFRMETLERVAQIVKGAYELGEPKKLPEASVKKLMELGKSFDV